MLYYRVLVTYEDGINELVPLPACYTGSSATYGAGLSLEKALIWAEQIRELPRIMTIALVEA